MFNNWKTKIKAKLPDKIANLVAVSNQELQFRARVLKEKQLAWQQTRKNFDRRYDETLLFCAKYKQPQSLSNGDEYPKMSPKAAAFLLGVASRHDGATPPPLPPIPHESSQPPLHSPPLSPSQPPPQQSWAATRGFASLPSVAAITTAPTMSPSTSPPTPPLRKTTDQLRPPTSGTNSPNGGTSSLNQKDIQAHLEKELNVLNDFKKYVDHAKASFHEEAKSFQSFLDGMVLCSARQDVSTLMDVWTGLLDTLKEEDTLCCKMLDRRKAEKEDRQSREKMKTESSNVDEKGSPLNNITVTGTTSGAVKSIDGRMEFGLNGGLVSIELGSILLCNEDVQETIFKLISTLMQRHEFNSGLSAANKTVIRSQWATSIIGNGTNVRSNFSLRGAGNPSAALPTYSSTIMTKEEGQLALRYRDLLVETQRWVNKKLFEAKSSECFYGSSPIGTFCSQVLAINSIRLPWLMDDILQKFELTDSQRGDLKKVIGESKFESLVSTTISQDDEKRICQQLNYLLLFGWKSLHEYLDQNFAPVRSFDPRNRSVSPQVVPKSEEESSMDILSRETFSLAFVAMWYAHLESILKLDRCYHLNSDGEWLVEIKGYDEITEWFMHYTYKKQETNFSRFQAETIKSMLAIDRLQLNNVMKVAFSKTQLYDFSAVIEGLNLIQSGMITIRNNGYCLPPNFDIAFFTKALDLIIQTDHFRCLQKVLTMLYFCSNLFTGAHKKLLISELLMDKYFFNLFLHWNSIVRNTFHQFLVFKVREPEQKVDILKEMENEDSDVDNL